jgi:hypothetical protein
MLFLGERRLAPSGEAYQMIEQLRVDLNQAHDGI